MSFCHGISPADILLPAAGVDLTRWAVIACDQYTSQSEYWQKVEETVGSSPSTLNLIQPEIRLDQADRRLPFIRDCMRRYLNEGVLTRRVTDGFVLTLRKTASGLRPGLVGKVDLDAYEFAPGNDRPVRASEGTIIERLPPRVKIREGAPLECPHIMLLVDDPKGTLVEAAYARVKETEKLYDFELMLGGGHLSGWKIEGESELKRIDEALKRLFEQGKGFLAAVGDGNHSLATAKACWEKLKKSLSEKEKQNHPARYALVEIVNLHCGALLFRPIHRAVFGADACVLRDAFSAYLAEKGLSLAEGSAVRFLGAGSYAIKGAEDVLPAVHLQAFLDGYLSSHPEASIDYVHGEEALREVCQKSGAAGIELGTIDKAALFPSVRQNGVLPRKSFSMGEADEKRFYMEARRIL